MMTPVHRRKRLQWAHECRNWTLEQWKKVAWSDESRFLLDHVDGRVRVHRLPGGSDVTRMHCGKTTSQWRECDALGNVLLGTLGPAIHGDVNLTRATYLNIHADHVHPFMAMVFPDGTGLFQ